MNNRVIRKMRHLLSSAYYEPAFWSLLASHHTQLDRYRELRKQFSHIYASISSATIDQFTTPSWKSFNSSLEKSLLPTPTYSFLRDPVISSTMVITKGGRVMRQELTWLEHHFNAETLKKILREDPIGHPFIANWRYRTSHNTIHHAHHLGRFLASTGMNTQDIGHIVEWGGGYGNLAKLYGRLSQKPHQWTIIDTPLMCVVQWLCLNSVLGPDRVHLITSPDEELQTSGITIIPVQWFDRYDLKADLFVSTWAISESPKHLQDAVASHWFGARHLLIGYQDSHPAFPDAGHIGELARHSGATIEDLPLMLGQHYAFK
jgi:hypothetical protein